MLGRMVTYFKALSPAGEHSSPQSGDTAVGRPYWLMLPCVWEELAMQVFAPGEVHTHTRRY